MLHWINKILLNHTILRLAGIGLDVVQRDVCELALDVVHGLIQFQYDCY